MTGPEAAARVVREPPRTLARAGRELRRRYTAADLSVLTREEASRFVPRGDGDPQTDAVLAWELLYRLEPELYDRLASAERLHPGVVAWLPRDLDRIAEVGAGTGRLTLELVGRARRVVAVEPALPLRRVLRRKLAAAGHGDRVRVAHGFFDRLPLPDDFADLVVACSAFTPAAGHGGEAGLAEMERVCRPGGRVAIIWPNHLDWLAARGYRYVSFPGPMSVEFGSYADAVELSGIFFPKAAAEVRRLGRRSVPFEILGINPPRDLAFKMLAAE
ncbi:MAG TPA: class I SAM-dependent methyltransferase [Streptosporangiaceae bacterium]|nr:class I SAM-dependent methyltransferase [Streptosporangiaceae bacterium]